jgi:uncharacterized protein YhfF
MSSIEIEAFWAAFQQATGEQGGYGSADPFGDSPELADELIRLVLDGPKRATAGMLAEFEREGAPVDRVGDRWIALDGAGHPRAVLRVTEVRIGPFDSVDAAFAWDEGEGDRTLDNWKADHLAYFTRRCAELRIAWSEVDVPIVFQRFELVWSL